MILLCQWYAPDCPKRAAELTRVRDANEGGGLFERCVYVDGEIRRWTYGDFLDLAAESFPGEVIVLANTDIEFDDTIKLAGDGCQKDRVIALTRWESPSSPRMLGHLHPTGRFFSGSQDTWVFRGGELASPSRLKEVPLGTIGCDQVCVAEWARAGCEVFNPALDIKTWHVHADEPPSGRASVHGFYGYPELTTLIGTGLVAFHAWHANGEAFSLEVMQTWRP